MVAVNSSPQTRPAAIDERPVPAMPGRRLAGAAALLLASAGLLLWWREGDAIFATYLLAAVAWCF